MKTTSRELRRRLPWLGLLLAFLALNCAWADSDSAGVSEIKRGKDGYWQVDFSQLASFPFTPPQTDVPVSRAVAKMHPFFTDEPQPIEPVESPQSLMDGVPQSIKALDGERVRLAGFMLPTRLENGLVREFLLIRSQMTCCYGIPPGPNEWVVAGMSGKGVPQKMDVPLHIYGVLHVGAMFENHEFSGLYRLDCEKVVAQ